MPDKRPVEKLPYRGWVIFISLCFLVAGFLGKYGKGCIEGCTTGQTSKSNFRQVPTEVKKTSFGAIVKMNGSEELGVNTGVTLNPGEKAQITHLKGQIACCDDHDPFPIWGADYYLPKWKNSFRYSKLPGIPAHAVLIILGKVGKAKKIIAFPPGQKTVIVQNSTNQPLPIVLYYHDILEYYAGNGYDGSTAIFEIKKLN